MRSFKIPSATREHLYWLLNEFKKGNFGLELYDSNRRKNTSQAKYISKTQEVALIETIRGQTLVKNCK